MPHGFAGGGAQHMVVAADVHAVDGVEAARDGGNPYDVGHDERTARIERREAGLGAADPASPM